MICELWGYLDGEMTLHNYKDLCAQYYVLKNDLSAPHLRKPATLYE